MPRKGKSKDLIPARLLAVLDREAELVHFVKERGLVYAPAWVHKALKRHGVEEPGESYAVTLNDYYIYHGSDSSNLQITWSSGGSILNEKLIDLERFKATTTRLNEAADWAKREAHRAAFNRYISIDSSGWTPTWTTFASTQEGQVGGSVDHIPLEEEPVTPSRIVRRQRPRVSPGMVFRTITGQQRRLRVERPPIPNVGRQFRRGR